jgi:hypothetical protein
MTKHTHASPQNPSLHKLEHMAAEGDRVQHNTTKKIITTETQPGIAALSTADHVLTPQQRPLVPQNFLAPQQRILATSPG